MSVHQTMTKLVKHVQSELADKSLTQNANSKMQTMTKPHTDTHEKGIGDSSDLMVFTATMQASYHKYHRQTSAAETPLIYKLATRLTSQTRRTIYLTVLFCPMFFVVLVSGI